MSHKRLIHCTFPKHMIREPLLYNLGRQFDIIPNIRGATIDEHKDIGLVYLELEGDEGEIERAVAYLSERGVQLEDLPGGMPPQS